jgi:signal transduction histidine kinase
VAARRGLCDDLVMTPTGFGITRAGLLLAAAGLAIAAAGVLYPSDPALHVVVTLGIAVGFVVAGVVAWSLRPANGIGPLMALLGMTLLLRKFGYGEPSPWAFTLGYALRDVSWVVFGHIVLAYPSGHLGSRFHRWVAGIAYGLAIALPLSQLLVRESDADLVGTSAIAIVDSEAAFDALRIAEYVVVYGALPAVFLALLAQKLATTTRRGRRMFLPLLVVGLALAVRGLLEAVFSFVSEGEAAEDVLFWSGQAMEVALGAALLVGVLRIKLHKATLADTIADLHGVSSTEVRDALARALRDPTLEVAFWVPERRTYVDASGEEFDFPVTDPRRAITGIRGDDGEPIASLVHDVALEDEPGLVRGAAAAARLALENARLHAELRAQLVLVQESRARIVAAGDEERRRIERDLHDGAQQRLVALALELRSTQRRLGDDVPDEVEAVLGGAVDELQRAVEDLRELAHGVHPSVLTQNGLAAALESLAASTPLPVTVAQAPAERLPAPIEAAAYFVACEALANAVKHANASTITISAVRADGRLVIEISDDGIGGADSTGSGLRGLADRVEAHGGRFAVESRNGEGTRVIGELPCES